MRAPPKRRWYQFSLQTLLVAMFVLCCFLGGFGWRWQRAKQQEAAVTTLLALGGDVVRYDFSRVENPDGTHAYDKRLKSPIPSFLIAFLGEDFFHNAVVVEAIAINRPSPKLQELQDFWRAVSRLPKLQSLRVGDGWLNRDGLAGLQNSTEIRELLFLTPIAADDLRAIGKLTQLTGLHCWEFSNQGVTDQGIACLDGLTNLKSFSVSDSNISDVGAIRFAQLHPFLEDIDLRNSRIGDDSAICFGKLSHLTRLEVCGTNVSNEGLEALRDLHSLRSLYISGTKITGSGLSGLQHLKELEFLSLESDLVTDADLCYLESLPSLKNIDLRNTKVTDEGLEKFKFPPRLKVISLTGTAITDRTLVVLARQANLKQVNVSQTKVTPAGLATLRKALPQCSVW